MTLRRLKTGAGRSEPFVHDDGAGRTQPGELRNGPKLGRRRIPRDQRVTESRKIGFGGFREQVKISQTAIPGILFQTLIDTFAQPLALHCRVHHDGPDQPAGGSIRTQHLQSARRHDPLAVEQDDEARECRIQVFRRQVRGLQQGCDCSVVAGLSDDQFHEAKTRKPTALRLA